MALSFLQPSFEIFFGLFPSLNLDFPMPDESAIRIRALLLERDLNSMICHLPSQTVKADS
jgi:hypothetical protein